MSTQHEELIAARAKKAYGNATTGDFRASEQCVVDLQSDASPIARAWSLALAAQRWHAEPSHSDLPTHASLEQFVDATPKTRAAAALACAEASRAAILSHQLDELEAWTALQQRLTTDCGDPWAVTWSKLSSAWLALGQSDVARAEELVEQAQALASRDGIAPAVIEATALRALCAEAQGDVSEATALARRGSRMARTEDLPQWQYLANLVLARMRRLNGVPHLTTRILQPLFQAAPVQWHGWVAWEALMAGALPLSREIALDSAHDPSDQVRGLQQLLDAASRGESAAFSEAADRLVALDKVWSSRQRDVALALTAIDARRRVDDADGVLEAWCLGRETAPPNAIKGLCIDLQSDPGDPGPAAFVVCSSDDSQPRRVAGLGEPLIEADAQIPRLRGAPERTLSTIAAIALAGPQGVTRSQLFKTVYGFDYDPELHRDLFKVLVYRGRKELGDLGELKTVDDDTYAIQPSGTLVIPDPRCEQSLEDRVLRALARRGAQSARETAEENGLPLRSAQRALKHLVENGALVVERARNAVTYRVEDTTFSEPTKWS